MQRETSEELHSAAARYFNSRLVSPVPCIFQIGIALPDHPDRCRQVTLKIAWTFVYHTLLLLGSASSSSLNRAFRSQMFRSSSSERLGLSVLAPLSTCTISFLYARFKFKFCKNILSNFKRMQKRDIMYVCICSGPTSKNPIRFPSLLDL
jgi:hypothetical protein